MQCDMESTGRSTATTSRRLRAPAQQCTGREECEMLNTTRQKYSELARNSCFQKTHQTTSHTEYFVWTFDHWKICYLFCAGERVSQSKDQWECQ